MSPLRKTAMKNATKRVLYAVIGLIATFLAVLGVLLPGLPATVFILVALWAFSNSSEKLHKWMLHIPLLRPAIREAHRFQREKTIDFRIKIVAQVFSWGSTALIILTTQNIWFSAFMILASLSCSTFMFFIPTSKPAIVTSKETDSV